MFNKKKKHWYNKPNYKRGTGDAQPVNLKANTGVEPSESMDRVQADLQDSFQAEDTENSLSEELQSVPITEESSSDIHCPICSMPIRNHYTAIRRKESGVLSHFDCVLRELSRENSQKLGKFRKIYYIGSGDFAIVKEFYDKRGHLKNYEIIEKINYESKA